MAEANLDHPGEITWFSGHGPAQVIGPCPHTACPHNMGANIAWGHDWQHYTLDRCDVAEGCNGGCRAWHDERSVPTSPWLQVEVAPVTPATRLYGEHR
jgi:hypothetical protein